jgi:hypothetical protein
MPSDDQVRRRAIEQDEMYQLDVVVSVFAIMLVILVALAAAGATAEGQSRLHYRPVEAGENVFMLRSVQVPYSDREIWAAGKDTLFRIDLAEIVKGLAQVRLVKPLAFSRDGADISLEEVPDGLAAWRLSILISDRDSAKWLKRRTISFADDDTLAAWAAERSSVIVFVWRDGYPRLSRLSELLRAQLRPYTLVLLADETSSITISYRRANFAYDKILRVY